MSIDPQAVQRILDDIALKYRGPGGAIAVIKDGELVGQRVWGYADIENHIAMTPQTQMPICSISKQFFCALMLDLERNPTSAMAGKGPARKQFEDIMAQILPPELTEGSGLTLQHLVDMQSGLRDYWAMTTLWGAKPDDEFLVERDFPPAQERTRSFHFTPGTEFSYCNVNFHVLGRIVERVAGEPLDKLLAERILGPAGMSTAFMCPDNAKIPSPVVGYEGSEQIGGYIPVINRIEWSGDGGLVASLEDMIAYEKYLDRLFTDSESWYRAITSPQTYADGNSAPYHYGMDRKSYDEVVTLGHSGGLRGFRSHRRNAPHERLSVVVFFNHEADVPAAASDMLRALLNRPFPNIPPVEPSAAWLGSFLDQDTQLAVTITRGLQIGELIINYEGSPEIIKATDTIHAKSLDMTASIEGNVVRIHRISENRTLVASRLVPNDVTLKDETLQGTYRSDEIDSNFHCSGQAGMLYGYFEGYLGRGIPAPLYYLGDDVWQLTCPRGLDAPAPGNWTMVLKRDDRGAVSGFKIGCWLARGIDFVKV
ncbi:hypothetical protein N7462_008046 [Penicillium macrosclerotiorum]|uniref:uncharacterized protein n=1 Tax=Penicillium macrosclerotiorum TaxID=303699 RepID=UPI0025471C37|nr:uncharacterized protein N7462_008046 [Penicillium macrosclerotiorum]KAJ5679802.1 hypothetical protein N7462_008046 [Penicillium macrosclerotiorum]